VWLFEHFGLEGVLMMVGTVLALMMIAVIAVRVEGRGASLDAIAQDPDAAPARRTVGLAGE
jgi:hypothetical protein